MKTLFGALGMITGVGVFGGDLSGLDSFGVHHFSGSVFAGAAVFLFGLSLWLNGVFGD